MVSALARSEQEQEGGSSPPPVEKEQTCHAGVSTGTAMVASLTKLVPDGIGSLSWLPKAHPTLLGSPTMLVPYCL